MKQIQKRILLFLFGCILTRLIFVWIAKTVPLTYLPYLGILALGPVIGWIWIIFIGSRDTGAEVFGEKIWWKDIRWVHLLLYATFATLAIMKKSYAWVLLLVDVTFGFMAWFFHHWYAGTFSKL
jgi:hypothetical protein